MTATSTSIQAYHCNVRPNFEGSECARILSFIAQRGGDWSIGELAKELGMQKSSVSARVNELIRLGDVEPAPKRKDRISGITVRPVRLPSGQVEIF